MKHVIITLFITLLSISACKKEDEGPSQEITGVVYEAGTNSPIRKADVAMLQYDYINGTTTIVSATKCDENGKYSLKNEYKIDGKSYYLIAESFDYYFQDKTVYTLQRIDEKVSSYNIKLFRKAKLKVRIISQAPYLSTDNITVYTPRWVSQNFEQYTLDTTIELPADGNVINNIKIHTTQNDKTYMYDTLIMVPTPNNEPILFTY